MTTKHLNVDNVQQFVDRWSTGYFHKDLRLGQAFVTVFGVENCYKHPEHQLGTCMFYEEDEGKVRAMIGKLMLEKQNTPVPGSSQDNVEGD
jgi:hypothetical protein